MKKFQIITAEGEYEGRFEVTFSEDVDVDDDLGISSSIEEIDVQYCYGDHWSPENPTSLDDKVIFNELKGNYDKVYWPIKNDDYIIKIIDDEVKKDRIFIKKEDREIYESIRKNDGDLKGCSNIELFLIAMMLGYHKKGKHGLKGLRSTARDGFVRVGSFTDEAWHIIKSIAVYEEEYMEVLLSNNKMFDTAEKYAIVGIKELEKEYFENEHNFLKRMEKLLIEEFEFQEIDEDGVFNEEVDD